MSLNPFEIRARLETDTDFDSIAKRIVLIPLKSGQGLKRIQDLTYTDEPRLNPFEIRARLETKKRKTRAKRTSLNPFEIRARLETPPAPIKTTTFGLNPFEIRARLETEEADDEADEAGS